MGRGSWGHLGLVGQLVAKVLELLRTASVQSSHSKQDRTRIGHHLDKGSYCSTCPGKDKGMQGLAGATVLALAPVLVQIHTGSLESSH